MKHVLVCRVDGTVEDTTLTKDRDWQWYAEQIGAKYIEPVHPKGLKDPYLFLCDEEGRLKARPVINFLGSWLYKAQDHGEPIVGDIVILKEISKDGEYRLDGMEPGEADVMADWLLEHFWEAHDAVMEKIGSRIQKD